jgi:hypothetical protein
MSISWKEGYKPDYAIDIFEDTRKIRADGKVVFPGMGLEFDSLTALIFSMIEFPESITELDARRMVTTSIFSAGKKGAITSKTLLKEINIEYKKYLALPSHRYVLATSISLSPFLKLDKIYMGNSILKFESAYPKLFTREADNLTKHAKDSLFSDLPKQYLKLRVFVTAKTTNQAGNEALDNLDFVRGILNWGNNGRHGHRITFGGKPSPVNEIILGPIHTLHETSGLLAAKNNWWYEPSYLGQIKNFSPKQSDFDALLSLLDHVKKILRHHKYPQIIRNAIIRYTRALDERDYTTAFLKIWSILELLTDTGKAHYGVTIRRAAFLFHDYDHHYQILQHLREYRNSYVHTDKTNSKAETYLYQTKDYVERLFRFHFFNKFKFDSLQQAGNFLDSPHTEKDLKRQLKILNDVKAYRGYK